MGITKNVPYGGGRIDKSCLGCAYFSGAISGCGKPNANPEQEVEFVTIKDAAHTTCRAFKFDKHTAPKL